MSLQRRRQFVAVWNSVYARCIKRGGSAKFCEGRAFPQAYGVVKELTMSEATEKLTAKVSVLREEGKEEEAQALEMALKGLETEEKGCPEEEHNPVYRPLGGALSYGEADSYQEALDQEHFMYDQEHLFRHIFDNVWASEELDTDAKVAAVNKALVEFTKRVKAGPEASKEGILDKIKGLLSPSSEGEKAVWTAIYINNLPDSAFAYVEPGGKKDAGGKTVPRSLRHFPFKGAGGKVDLPHLRNALARAPQSPFGPKAMPKLRAAAEAAGVGQFAKKSMLGTFQAFKDFSGVWRWISITTNKFKDREGEIFSEKSHEEFIAHVDATGNYPELRLWHVPGSCIGKADFLGGHAGFVLHSGIFDEGMEDVAESLSKAKELAVSHGYKYEGEDREDGIYEWYRTFEISPLPLDRAANVYTDFASESKEESIMQLTAEKRAFLVEHMGEERVVHLEEGLTKLSKELEEGGVAFKDIIEATEVPSKTDEDPKPEETPSGSEAGKEGDPPKDKEDPKPEPSTELGEIKGLLEKATEQLGEQDKAITELQRTDEEKIAAKLAPRQQDPDKSDGDRPSQSDATKVEKKDVEEHVEDPEEGKSPVDVYAAQLTGKGAVSEGGGIRQQ